jgi:hypothetical protein
MSCVRESIKDVVCLFYLAICNRLKQSLISVRRLTSETKEKLKTSYIRRLFMVNCLSQDATVYMILHK